MNHRWARAALLALVGLGLWCSHAPSDLARVAAATGHEVDGPEVVSTLPTQRRGPASATAGPGPTLGTRGASPGDKPLTPDSPLWLHAAAQRPACSPELEQPLDAAAAKAQRQATWRRMLDDLVRSPEAEWHAAGLYLADQGADLLREAQANPSPALLSWAWQACQRAEPKSRLEGCAALTPHTLLDAQAGEAHTLLMALLQQAVTDRDAVAVDQTLARLAQTEPKSPPTDRLLALIMAQWKANTPNRLRAATLERAVGAWAAIPLPAYQHLLTVCHPEVLAIRPARRPNCEGVAQRMAEQGNNLQQTRLGLRLGEVLGWPEARVRLGRMTADAGSKAWGEIALAWARADGRLPSDCASLQLQQQWALNLAARGEQWHLQWALALSGHDLAWWVNQLPVEAPRPVGPAPSTPL